MENNLVTGVASTAVSNTHLSFQLSGWPAAATLICISLCGLAGYAIHEFTK